MSSINVEQTQVGGDHYLQHKIQPLKLSYLVAEGDATFCKVIKYITRDKENLKEDFEKAIHVLQLKKQIVEELSGSNYPQTLNYPLDPTSKYILKYAFEHMEKGDFYIKVAHCMINKDLDGAITHIQKGLEFFGS